MTRFGFAPASPEETVIYGAQRPGYSSQNVDASRVSDWISFVHKSGVRRICCLLPDNQLAYYRVDLLKTYREAFGQSNVCHAPIEDYHLCDHWTLEGTILPFLQASDATSTPAVVHCSGGLGRTGHVLAAWLVRHRSVGRRSLGNCVART